MYGWEISYCIMVSDMLLLVVTSIHADAQPPKKTCMLATITGRRWTHTCMYILTVCII